MADIKTPDGGFYLDSSEFNVDYVKNKISLVGGTGGGGSSDITANGGTFNADAVLQGTDNLQITVPDAGESATVGVTPESVTISHNTNSDADGSIRVTAGGVELKGGDTTVQVNGTSVNFGGAAIANVASIGSIGASTPVAFEEDIDMNHHRIDNTNGLSFVGDPFITAENTLGVSVPESEYNRSAAVFSANMTAMGLAQQDDYIYGMIVQNLETDSYQPTVGIGAMDINGLTSEDDYLANAKGILIDYSGNIKFTSDSSIDFGNVPLTNVANPVNNTDAVNKQYADSTYAAVNSIPTAATTSTAGIVKQISNIAQLDASTATTEQIATTVNSLLTALQNAGIMSAT